MANVIVDKSKIDLLANAISAKSGEPLTLTLDEMVEAVDGIKTGGGGVTPTGNIDITSAGVTDVTNYATATVPEGEMYATEEYSFYTENNQRKWRSRGVATIESGDSEGTEGYIADHTVVYGAWNTRNAVASGTSVTPTESAQTIGGANYMMEGAVTVNAIPSNYVGSGITQRTSSDLSASGATVSVPSGFYENNASKAVASGSLGTELVDITKTSLDYDIDISFPQFVAGYIGTAPSVEVSLDVEDKSITPSASQQVVTPTDNNCYLNSVTVAAVPSGTEGTPTATKGTVTNHSVSITPSVTNTAGYISGGTHSGTAVTVTASELASGNKAITQNGTDIDVVGYSTVSVNVSGTSKNTQVVQGTTRTTAATMTAIGAELTVSKTGTYDIYWSGFRTNTSASYTFATQLYIDGIAHGSENATWSNNVQNNHLTAVSLTVNQKLRVYGRESRGSTYYMYAPTLVIVEN